MINYEAFFKLSYGLYIVSSGNQSSGNGFVSNPNQLSRINCTHEMEILFVYKSPILYVDATRICPNE